MKSKQDLLNSVKILLQSEILSREVVMLREKDRAKRASENNRAFCQLKVLEHEMNVLQKDWEKAVETNEQMDIERNHLKSQAIMYKKENKELEHKLTESNIMAGHSLAKLKAGIEADMEQAIGRKDKETGAEIRKLFRETTNEEAVQDLAEATKELAVQKLSAATLFDKFTAIMRYNDELAIAMNGYKNWNDVLRSKLCDAENTVVAEEG